MSRADYIHDRMLHSDEVDLFTVNLFTVKLPQIISMGKSSDSWSDDLPETFIRALPVDVFIDTNGKANESVVVESNVKWTVE